jgi:succinoglycan biosynthesis transport protein ExoP
VTIAQYLRLLREQWLPVLLLSVLGALGAGTFSLLAPKVYEARTQLFVSTAGQPGSLVDLSQGSAFTHARVKSYTDLLTSSGVLDPVITDLGLDTTAEALSERITATSPLDTVLIDVTVEDGSPRRAAATANAIAAHFPAVVKKLEAPAGQDTSPVKVSVTRPAVPATHPVSPRTSLNLALGLLVGLGLGLGTAVLRDTLNRTVKDRAHAGEVAQAPVLGAVPDDPQSAQTPLINHDTFSLRAEAFRQLRTNIRFLSVDRQVKSIVVTGSVPAEGKTTTAANIAIALAQAGETVVLVDADLRRPSVADLFGVPNGVGLTTVLVGDSGVDTALQRWHDDLPLFVLAAGPLPPNPSELIGSARMADLVRHLTDHGMTVVVDSPPLLPVTDAAILARITDGALVVTRAASTKVDQFRAAIESLRTAGAPILGVVLNRIPRRAWAASGYSAYHQDSYAPDPGRSPQLPVTVTTDRIFPHRAPAALETPPPHLLTGPQPPHLLRPETVALPVTMRPPEPVGAINLRQPCPAGQLSSSRGDTSPQGEDELINGVSVLGKAPSPYPTPAPGRPHGRRSAPSTEQDE